MARHWLRDPQAIGQTPVTQRLFRGKSVPLQEPHAKSPFGWWLRESDTEAGAPVEWVPGAFYETRNFVQGDV